MSQWERLERISRVMEYLEIIERRAQHFPNEKSGLLMAQLDWLEELHGLLYDL